MVIAPIQNHSRFTGILHKYRYLNEYPGSEMFDLKNTPCCIVSCLEGILLMFLFCSK